MFRNLVPPKAAAADLLAALDQRLTRAERAASWPGAVHHASVNTPSGPVPNPELMSTPGYPTNPLGTVTLTLDPGRWIVAYRTCTSVAASDGGEVAMIGRAEYDGQTVEIVQRGGGDVVAVLYGDGFVLGAALEVKAVSQVELSLLVYWGYFPLVTPLPYLEAGFTSATIVAYPG